MFEPSYTIMFVVVTRTCCAGDRAEMGSRIYTIDTEWTVGHGEPIPVAKYEQLYLTVSYEDSNCVDTF